MKQSKEEQIKAICEEIKQSYGVDYRYDHFREKEAVPPPFLIYRRQPAPSFSADNKTYFKDGGVDLELYASTPDEMDDLKEKVEQLLNEYEIYYNLTADTTYIESEEFYESLYEM
ncbi:MAG: hypothetical protein IJI23_00215 [Lachnospiraceae bacterium]|nr:hypothetical protein [Lachnospiraceae bacterium]